MMRTATNRPRSNGCHQSRGIVVRSKITLMATLALSAGCVPVPSFFVRPGVTMDQYQRDSVACANVATANAPASNQVNWDPVIGIYTVDANDPLRLANMQICMRDRGYSYVPVPLCKAEQVGTAIHTGFGRMEDLQQRMSVSAHSCFVPGPRGEGPRIYTP